VIAGLGCGGFEAVFAATQPGVGKRWAGGMGRGVKGGYRVGPGPGGWGQGSVGGKSLEYKALKRLAKQRATPARNYGSEGN